MLENLARTLGAGEWRVFFTITLPLARTGIVGGVLLTFARALGEFGATIMVAGNMPGRTTTLSVALYQHIQAGDDAYAWWLAGISAVLAFAAVWSSELLLRRRKK
jgi:molybdate transport system permease protein